jgi:hypothetical protein
MPVKVYDGTNWVTVAGDGQAGAQGTSSAIATWVKTASGGETSVSGTGDTGYGTLAYTVGQELVYLNGVLLDRGDDYTATTGTSITGLTALAANDIITVWTVNSFSVANTYTIAQADAAFAPIAGAGATNWTLLNAGGTALTGATKITVSFTAPKQLLVLMVGASSGNARSFFEIRPNDDSGADYSTGGFFVQPDNITLSEGVGSYSAKTEISFGTMSNNAASIVQASLFMDLCNQTGTKFYSVTAGGNPGGGQGHQLFAQQGLMEAGATITSVAVTSSTGNFDAGTLYVFGAN